MEHEVIARLRAAMKQSGSDALVALSPDNVTYTAGFAVPSHAINRFRRTVTVIAGDAFARQIVVSVEENLARQRSRFVDIRAYDQFSQDPADVLADALAEAGAASGRVAIELDYMPAKDYIRLRERLPNARFVPCSELYFTARMVKTDEEIALLTKVGQLTDRVAGEVLREIRPGMTEKAVGQIITDKMMAGGCDSLKYQVGSGVRSGITNCTPTDKVIERGDVIRVEILGDMDQYRSNVTSHRGRRRADRRAAQDLGRDDRRPRTLQDHVEAGHRGRRSLSDLRRFPARPGHRADAAVSRPRHWPDHPRGALHHGLADGDS